MASSSSAMMKGSRLRDILQKAEMLVNENKRLGEKAESIMKKMRENNEEARTIVVSEAKKLIFQSQSNQQLPQERSDQVDVVEDEIPRSQNLSNGGDIPSQDVELPRVVCEKGPKKSVAQLNFEKKVLMKRMAKSASNLQDHRNVLDVLEKEGGRSNVWVAKMKEVQVYSKIHKKFKEASEQRLETIRVELRHRTAGMFRDHFELNQGASSSRVVARTRSQSLNESVLDCGRILKRVAPKEIAAMTPQKLKEEDSPEAPHVCNFENCQRSFTCASPFVAHLENHRIQNLKKIPCPFPNCDYSNKREELTTHMRAKHTKELLFRCDHCPTQFHTMQAKAVHEKKHSLPDVWAQCSKDTCLRFYQVAIGYCKACGKK